MQKGLETTHLEIDSTAGAGAFTDYYPFGFAMPGRQYITGSPYRFGYQGQFAEKDEETGLNHFEARFYDSRIGRWLTTDPANQYWSPYLGMGNNWPGGVDPDGRFWQELGNWIQGNGWKSNVAVSFAKNHPDWSWDRKSNSFFKLYNDGDPSEGLLGSLGKSPTFGPIKDFRNPFNNLASYFDWNLTYLDQYMFRFTKLNEVTKGDSNIFGEYTITKYHYSSIGNGQLNIIHVNKEYFRTSSDIKFGIGSVSIGHNGSASVSLGLRNHVQLGVSHEGVSFGFSSNINGMIHGTRLAWRPSNLYNGLLLAPIKATNPSMRFIPL